MKIKINKKTSYKTIFVCFMCAIAVAFAYTVEPSFAASSIKKAKVKEVKVRTVANKTVQVSWKRIAVADGYTVYYATKKNGKYKKGKSVVKRTSSAKICKLVLGRTYYFKVRPFVKKGTRRNYGEYSKVVKCVVKPAAPKAKELIVSPTIRKVTFTKVAGVSGYEVWRAVKINGKKRGKYKRIKTLSAKTRTFTNKKLNTKNDYFYKVRAYARNGKTKVYGGFSPVATIVSGGNAAMFNIGKIVHKGGSIKGRRILFLGSSVTVGLASNGVSFVDYLKKVDGVQVVAKEAVSGTTISFAEPENYCVRMEKYKGSSGAELLVCQLSSNDARISLINNPLTPIRNENPDSGNETDEGDVPSDPSDEEGDDVSGEEGRDDVEVEEDPIAEKDIILSELRYNAEHGDGQYRYVDDAIKYIIAYSNLELGCPVLFYIIPPFKNTKTFNADFYKKMRRSLLDISNSDTGWINSEYNIYEKDFQVEILDLWADKSFSTFTTYNQTRKFYMRDSVHPTKAGYYQKYLPKFETKLKRILK